MGTGKRAGTSTTSCCSCDAHIRRADAAEAVLREFVKDFDAVGLEHVRDDWPDLVTTYWHAREHLEGKLVYECGNGCGSFGPEMVKKWWPDLDNIRDRISPGERVPDCECPVCGALAHRINGTPETKA